MPRKRAKQAAQQAQVGIAAVAPSELLNVQEDTSSIVFTNDSAGGVRSATEKSANTAEEVQPEQPAEISETPTEPSIQALPSAARGWVEKTRMDESLALKQHNSEAETDWERISKLQGAAQNRAAGKIENIAMPRGEALEKVHGAELNKTEAAARSEKEKMAAAEPVQPAFYKAAPISAQAKANAQARLMTAMMEQYTQASVNEEYAMSEAINDQWGEEDTSTMFDSVPFRTPPSRGFIYDSSSKPDASSRSEPPTRPKIHEQVRDRMHPARKGVAESPYKQAPTTMVSTTAWVPEGGEGSYIGHIETNHLKQSIAAKNAKINAISQKLQDKRAELMQRSSPVRMVTDKPQ